MKDLIKELPNEMEEIDQDLLLAEGEYSREEKNGEAEEQQLNEENKENIENNSN